MKKSDNLNQKDITISDIRHDIPHDIPLIKLFIDAQEWLNSAYPANVNFQSPNRSEVFDLEITNVTNNKEKKILTGDLEINGDGETIHLNGIPLFIPGFSKLKTLTLKEDQLNSITLKNLRNLEVIKFIPDTIKTKTKIIIINCPKIDLKGQQNIQDWLNYNYPPDDRPCRNELDKPNDGKIRAGIEKLYINSDIVGNAEIGGELEIYGQLKTDSVTKYDFNSLADLQISGMKKIKKVFLGNFGSKDGVYTLKKLSLENLEGADEISICPVNSSGKIIIKGCPNIETLTIVGQLNEHTFDALVNSEKGNDTQIADWKNSLRNLKIFLNQDSKKNTSSPTSQLTLLQGFNKLEKLDLGGSNFLGSWDTVISDMKNLTEIKISGVENISGSLETLKDMDKLNYLDISRTNIGSEDDTESQLSKLPENLNKIYCTGSPIGKGLSAKYEETYFMIDQWGKYFDLAKWRQEKATLLPEQEQFQTQIEVPPKANN